MNLNELSFMQWQQKFYTDHTAFTDYLEKISLIIDENEQNIKALVEGTFNKNQIICEFQKLFKQQQLNKEKFPLLGLLVGVKDIFRVDGYDTKAGSKLPKECFAGKESEIVTKLKKSGAIVLGKTVTTEFAYFQPGPTRNPRNTAYTPGGSSSGSAAAVAANYCPLALGTQTIGSITRPAAFCGVYGFKPSFGRISTEGVIPFSVSADHIGFFANSMDDLAFFASYIIDGFDSRKNTKCEKLIRVGIPQGKYLEQADDEVLKWFNAAIEKLKANRVHVIELAMLNEIENINLLHKKMIAVDFAKIHQFWYEKHKPLYSKHAAELIGFGQDVNEHDYKFALNNREKLRFEIESAMKAYNIQLLIAPSTVNFPNKGIESTGSPLMNLPWTHTGMPTINIPAGINENNLPFGLQLIGFYNNDEDFLHYSKKIDTLLN